MDNYPLFKSVWERSGKPSNKVLRVNINFDNGIKVIKRILTHVGYPRSPNGTWGTLHKGRKVRKIFKRVSGDKRGIIPKNWLIL